MWQSIKNLGTKIKNTAEFIYNKIQPTLQASKETLLEIWTLMKDLGNAALHTLSTTKATLQVAEQIAKAGFKTGKSLTWDIAKIIIAINRPQASAAEITSRAKELKEATEQCNNDLAEALTHTYDAITHGAEALSNAGNASCYTADAVYRTATTVFYTGKTLYHVGGLTLEGVTYAAQTTACGVRAIYSNMNAINFLPQFNRSKANANLILALPAPNLAISPVNALPAGNVPVVANAAAASVIPAIEVAIKAAAAAA